jgi:hypothetical protein
VTPVAAVAVSGCIANAGNTVMMMCAVGRGGWAWGCSGWWGLRGASRRAAVACRQFDRRCWGSVVEVQCPSNMHGAAGAGSLAPSLGNGKEPCIKRPGGP